MQNKRVLRIRKPPMLLRKRSSSCRLESTDLNIAIVQAGSSFLYNATYCLKSIFLKTVSSVSFSLNRHLYFAECVSAYVKVILSIFPTCSLPRIDAVDFFFQPFLRSYRSPRKKRDRSFLPVEMPSSSLTVRPSKSLLCVLPCQPLSRVRALLLSLTLQIKRPILVKPLLYLASRRNEMIVYYIYRPFLVLRCKYAWVLHLLHSFSSVSFARDKR